MRKTVARTDPRGRFQWNAAPNETVELEVERRGFFGGNTTVEAGATEPVTLEMRGVGRE